MLARTSRGLCGELKSAMPLEPALTTANSSRDTFLIPLLSAPSTTLTQLRAQCVTEPVNSVLERVELNVLESALLLTRPLTPLPSTRLELVPNGFVTEDAEALNTPAKFLKIALNAAVLVGPAPFQPQITQAFGLVSAIGITNSVSPIIFANPSPTRATPLVSPPSALALPAPIAPSVLSTTSNSET